MTNYLYIDASGQQRGPVNDEQLKELAAQGAITPQTPMETDAGHKGLAGQIPGLVFNTAAASPFTAAIPVSHDPSTVTSSATALAAGGKLKYGLIGCAVVFALFCVAGLLSDNQDSPTPEQDSPQPVQDLQPVQQASVPQQDDDPAELLDMERYTTGKATQEEINTVRTRAERGDAHAQLILGLCHLRGEGVPKSAVETAKWLRKSADQGNPFAQHTLALCYLAGEGVPESKAEAAKWYRKAAEQGLADSQAELGAFYISGTGVPQNVGEGVKWLRMAAMQGHKEAISILNSLAEMAKTQQEREVQATQRAPQRYSAPQDEAPRFDLGGGQPTRTFNQNTGYPSSSSQQQYEPQYTRQPSAPRTCEMCDGSGRSRNACTTCRGKGVDNQGRMACISCNGRGFMSCGMCSGTGQRK
jgi:hypothetical protein